jgi:hypothetical protein
MMASSKRILSSVSSLVATPVHSSRDAMKSMMTVAASCRQQKRHPLTFLVEVCLATLTDTSPPLLVQSFAPG